MKKIILDVLEYFKNANLHSESARESIVDEIIKKLDTKEYYYSRDLMHSKINANSPYNDGYTNEAYEKFLDEYEGVSKVIPQDTKDKKDEEYEEYEGGHLG
tara:strand:- start:3460 stop:3762 length:303 start_codon:yes stop_codon:yes gene_type:complete